MIEHKIDLTDDRPIRCKPYPLPYAKRDEIREEIKNMMVTGIVRESSSLYASPLVLVKKKDGSNRMCVDYRNLNLVTVEDPAPMSTAEDLFGKLGKCQYYSTIDLSKGYRQIPVAKEDIHKTAFVTPHGCYEFPCMPFGIKNSGATLVRGMRKLLQDMDNVECYIDDLIVYTKDWATHLQVLDKLLEKLRQAGLVIRPTRCVFGSKSVEFLGRSIGENCISINEENLEKIRSAKRPTTKNRSWVLIVGSIVLGSCQLLLIIKTSLFETIRLFSYRVCRNCCRVFLCHPTCLLISRNFHCDAMIPVVKLFWWVALEPTTNTKCKPEQSQWVLLKLESCCDVIKQLFSTGIKAGQHNVPAQKVFLEDNGCNVGGCSACDVITLS